jgi:hypothetical protein
MAQKIIIFFPVGGFGSTLEYCIRRFSLEFETIDASIQDNGSMHGLPKESHLLWQDDLKKIKDSSHSILTPVYPNLNNTTVTETVSHFKSFYDNQKVIFITLDNEEAVEKNELFANFKIPNKIAVQCNIQNIQQWNQDYKTVFDMQRWELREYLSLMYEDLFPMMLQAKTLSEKAWLNINPQTLLNSFEETVKRVIQYLDLTLDDEQGLQEFSQFWLSKQQYIIDKHLTVKTIFESTTENKNYNWDSLDITSEALLQYKFKKQGMLLKCFGLNNFPTSTQDLQKCFE